METMASKNGFWLKPLLITCLGAMVLSILCLLPGCGSEGGKKDKTAASAKGVKPLTKMPLTNFNGGTVKREPLPPTTEVYPGLTVREVEERMVEARKRAEAPDYQVFPGITKSELDAKISAQQRTAPEKTEIFPGLTKQELDARMAAHLSRSGNDGLPAGITKEELNAKLEEDRQRRESPSHEVMPGLTKAELDAKLRAAGKQQ